MILVLPNWPFRDRFYFLKQIQDHFGFLDVSKNAINTTLTVTLRSCFAACRAIEKHPNREKTPAAAAAAPADLQPW